ncbi:MAG: extracellular solute-binding protein, partial [Betaproteobacteria bacterium]
MVKKTVLTGLVLGMLAILVSQVGIGAAEPIKITFWYSLGGKIAETTRTLVDEFNGTHPNIQVQAVYQGSYDDAINKLKTAIQTKSTPHVMQVYDIGTKFMIDSKAIVPMQKWIDKDKVDISTF